MSGISFAIIKAAGTVRETPLCDVILFFAASNGNSHDVCNATSNCVKLRILFEVLLTFSVLHLKNSAGLSLNSP